MIVESDGGIDFCQNSEEALRNAFLSDAHIRILRLPATGWTIATLVAPKDCLLAFEAPKSPYLLGWAAHMAGDSERLGIGQKFAADMRALGFSLRDLPDRLTPYLDFGAETKDRPFRLGQFTLCDFVFASVTCPQLLSDQAIAQLQRLWERCHSLVYRTNEQMTIALDNRWLSLAADHGTEGARAFGMGAILNAPGKMKGQVATRAIDSIQQLLRQDDAVVDLEALDLNPVQRAIPPLEFPSLEPLISGTPSKTVDQLDPDLALELFEQRARLAKALAHPGHYGRVRAAHSKLTPKHPPSRRATDAMSSYLAFVEQRFPELTCQEWIEPVLSENAL